MAVSFQSSYFTHLYGSAAAQQTSNDSITITTAESNATTQAIIVDLVFANSKSIRTSTIILATFNALAAFTTAFSIIYDSYWAQARRCAVPNYKTKQPVRKFCVSQMHPAETFPLILNIGIGIQSIVFAGVQGTGLHSLFIDGCTTISQFMWPALFIVPYIEVVFGLECMRRACRHKPFQPRGKYDVSFCLVLVVLMLVGTWIPSRLDPEPDHCFASLLWFISGFGELGFILLAIVLGLSIISAITICVRLSTFTMIDQHQRIAASRMVYYLVLGSLSVSFVIPYFILITLGIASTTSSMIATVVLNISGLMTGVLQLFLRSNTTTTAFKPKNLPNWSGDKHDIRLFGPNELGFDGHLLQPVSGPRASNLERTESQRSILSYEKGRRMSIDSLRSPPPTKSPQRSPTYSNTLASNTYALPLKPAVYNNQNSKLPMIPEPTAAGSSVLTRNHQRKPSYSLYPAEGSNNSQKMQLPATTFTTRPAQPAPSQLTVPQSKFQSTSPQEPFFSSDVQSDGDDSPTEETFFGLSSSSSRKEGASVYSIGALLPPPPLFRNGSRHRRNSSVLSTATVQIGLRLSNANQVPKTPKSPDRLVEMPPPLSLPSTTYRAINPRKDPRSPPPFPNTPISPHRPTPLTQANAMSRSNSSKTLPSSPRPIRSTPTPTPALERIVTQETIRQLSPSVYSPQKSQASSILRSGSAASSHAPSHSRSNPLIRKDSQRTQRRFQEDSEDDDFSSSASISATSSRSTTPTQEQRTQRWI